MNSLFGEFFRDFWPDFWPRFLDLFLTRLLSGVLTKFLAPKNTVCSTTGTEKYSVQYYPDREYQLFTIYYSKFNKSRTLF